MGAIALVQFDDELAGLRGEVGALAFPLGEDKSRDIHPIVDFAFEIGRLERRMADAACLWHCVLRRVVSDPQVRAVLLGGR